MTTAVLKRKATPVVGVTLADVSQKISELTSLEAEQFAEFGRQLNHGDDAEPARRALQGTREKLSILYASRSALQQEQSEDYDGAIAALSKQYRVAAEAFDNSLDALLKAISEVHRIGSEIRSRAYTAGDPRADHFRQLPYDPGYVVNPPSEVLRDLFSKLDPWKHACPSLWTLAQNAGLVEED